MTRCLDSIYALDLSEDEFEVITVDDASTDDTLTVLEDYAIQHSNLRIVKHLVNRNLGAARNSGLSVAMGRFISYVDSDDEIGPGIVPALKMAFSKDLDLVASRVSYFDCEGNNCLQEDSLSESSDRVFSGIDFQTEHPFWHSGVHGYVFSTNLLKRVQYPFVEGAYYEDADYICRHLLDVKRMAYCDECGYKYYHNPDSITHSMSAKHVFGYTYLGVRMLKLFELLEDQSSIFAQSILEGGSFSIMRGFKLLPRLHSAPEVRKFYNLLDARVDRSIIRHYKEPSYCWTWRTRFGIRHRYGMTFLAGIESCVRRSFMRLKH